MARILLVDDDPSMRERLESELRGAGYEVQTAADGIAGGYGVLQRRPDLIVSDVRMPHLDGYEFIAALRSETALSSIPVIFILAEGDAPARARELRAVGCVPKPVHSGRLLSMIKAHVVLA